MTTTKRSIIEALPACKYLVIYTGRSHNVSSWRKKITVTVLSAYPCGFHPVKYRSLPLHSVTEYISIDDPKNGTYIATAMVHSVISYQCGDIYEVKYFIISSILYQMRITFYIIKEISMSLHIKIPPPCPIIYQRLLPKTSIS